MSNRPTSDVPTPASSLSASAACTAPTTPTSEQKKATLDKTELEAYVAIVTGAQPIDYFDTFVSEWKRLGGDAIAQEVQEYFAQ